MRKSMLSHLTLILALLTLTACTDGPKPDTLDLDEDLECMQRGVSAPEWVCGNVEHDEMQITIGKAPMSKIGTSFTMSEATADGVEKIKRDTYQYVQKRVRTFARTLSPELGALTNAAEDSIATAVTEADDKDFKQIKEWEHPVDKELFVLIGIQNKWLDRQTHEELLLLYKKDSAVWEAFEDDDGEDELEDFFD